MEIIALVLIIVGCILCHKLSASYNQHTEEKYCQGCINWLWSVITALLLAATLLTIGENMFWLFLLFTFGIAGLSAWLCYKKMLGCGATSKEAGLGSAAQVASAIGIAATIIFILLLLFGGSGKKRRRR